MILENGYVKEVFDIESGKHLENCPCEKCLKDKTPKESNKDG